MSVFDPNWKYVHSTATDIRKTIAKARREIAKKQRAEAVVPKLKLMFAPSATAAPSLSDAASRSDTRGTPALDSAHRTNVSRFSLAPVQRHRRIPSW